MKKKLLSLFVALTLIPSLFAVALPAVAQEGATSQTWYGHSDPAMYGGADADPEGQLSLPVT